MMKSIGVINYVVVWEMKALVVVTLMMNSMVIQAMIYWIVGVVTIDFMEVLVMMNLMVVQVMIFSGEIVAMM